MIDAQPKNKFRRKTIYDRPTKRTFIPFMIDEQHENKFHRLTGYDDQEPEH